LETFLITIKASGARRRRATTEAYGAIRRKPAPAKAGGGASEGNAADDALMVIRGRKRLDPSMTTAYTVNSIYCRALKGLKAIMTRFKPPSRKEYLRQQKIHHGRHVFGVFPAQYPKEILWAHNVLPVEIWDPPVETIQANAHLQSYICSVVRLGLELVLQGYCDDLDAFLFPHTCDSIQNLASIVNDYLGIEKPCYFFYHPKAPYRPSSRMYYLDQLKDLAARLGRQWGPVDNDELMRRVKQGQQLTSLLKEAYEERSEGRLEATNEEFYRVIRQGEFLHPDDFEPLLRKFLETSKGRSRSKQTVILSGVLPSPPGLLRRLDELGVAIADDDLLSCSRRLLAPPSASPDPFEALADSYFALPPCTTKDSPIQERLDHLLAKVKRSKARGVIFSVVKFCEPELFDVPQIVEELKKRDLATLVMDVELHQGLSGQMDTRVEAFVEMMT
jgi:benzoyl-CoA reductase/2-hydroxyglutaryl-CoA dehydratase subunit BcrC/BadD/HgdB